MWTPERRATSGRSAGRRPRPMFVMSTIPDPPAAATRRSSWTHTSGSSTIRLSARLCGFQRRKPSVSIETGAVGGGAFRSCGGLEPHARVDEHVLVHAGRAEIAEARSGRARCGWARVSLGRADLDSRRAAPIRIYKMSGHQIVLITGAGGRDRSGQAARAFAADGHARRCGRHQRRAAGGAGRLRSPPSSS